MHVVDIYCFVHSEHLRPSRNSLLLLAGQVWAAHHYISLTPLIDGIDIHMTKTEPVMLPHSLTPGQG